MPDHLLAWLIGTVTGAVLAGIATRVRLLPEVVDLSILPTAAGVGSLLFAGYGAARGFPPERLGRATLLGTLLGGGAALLILLLLLLLDVLF